MIKISRCIKCKNLINADVLTCKAFPDKDGIPLEVFREEKDKDKSCNNNIGYEFNPNWNKD